MTPRRAAAPIAAVVLLVLAALLALAAEDVRRLPDRLHGGDLRYRADPTGAEAWGEGGLSGSLLAVEDDLAYRRALQRFRRSRAPAGDSDIGFSRLQAKAQAEAALAEVERRGAGPLPRSLAANLLAILTYEDYLSTSSRTSKFLEQSLEGFGGAIRTEPGNEEAKYNLELLLHLTESRPGSPSGSTGGAGGTETDEGGAGIGTPGEGY